MFILFTGAPGSRWSSVVESIYRSPDVDQSDGTSGRLYNKGKVKHVGSYFDPGMEFDNNIENWNKPFSGKGKRIIKSHTFAHQLEDLKTLGYPIVMCYRSNLECYDWWVEAGGFDISYPNYSYFENLDKEADALEKAVQNVLDEVLRTKDILSKGMKEVSTFEMGDAIISKLQ